MNAPNTDTSGIPSYRHDWMTRLVKSPVFRQLPPANIRRIVSNLQEEPRRRGEIIARQGESLEHFIVIKSGQCNLLRATPKGQQKLAMLYPGDYFGSIALLARQPNGVTMTMDTDGELMLLPKDNFTTWMFEFLLTRAIAYRKASELAQKGALWVDVRDKAEYDSSHLPHSFNLPLNHLYLPFSFLRDRIKPLQDKKAFLFYSDNEQRASAAVFRFMEQGKPAFMLAGGFEALPNNLKTEKSDSEFLQQQQAEARKRAALETKQKAVQLAQLKSQRQAELKASEESADLLAQVRAEAERLEQEKLRRVEAEKKRLRDQRAKLAAEKERLEEEKRKERQMMREEFKEQLRAQQIAMEMEKLKAEEEARLLKLQRDVARAVAEQEEEREKLDKQPLDKKVSSEGMGLGSIIGVILLVFGLVSAVWLTPLGDMVLPSDKPVTPPSPPIAVNDPPSTPQPTGQSTPNTQITKTLELPPKPLGAFRDRLQNGASGPEMIKLPGGTFKMGSDPSLPYPSEHPIVEITLQPFSISSHEITFAEYDRFVAARGRRKPRDNGWGRGDRPVINVSWEDASAYAQWLSIQTGKFYRLPSEREWEYAAGAGTRTMYWWGDDIGTNRANCALCESEWDARSTSPVGKFDPNPFGLYDMLGNVLEWTQTCPYRNYRNVPTSGNLYDQGQCDRGRVVRGGSYKTYSEQLRITRRTSYPTAARANDLGFRVVRVQ